MKVLVDTSAWVDFLNGYPSPEGTALAELFESDHDLCTCGVVVAEVFQGLREERALAEFSGLFRELTFLEPSSVDLYFRSAEVYRQFRRKGITIRSTIDCLIAVLAEENGCAVLSKDRDLAKLCRSGLLDTHLWPGVQ